jgi:hypothetical protein
LTADDCVQIAPAGECNLAVGEKFQVPGEFTSGTAYAFGDTLYFAQVETVEREDAVGLSQFGLLDDYGFGLISSRPEHRLPFSS